MEYSYILSITLGLAVAYVAYLLVKTLTRRYRYNVPPGARVPMTTQLHLHVWDHKEKFGHVSQMKILGFEAYVLNTIDAIRHALLSPELSNYTASRDDNIISQIVFNNGVVMCKDSENFRRMRALVFNTFKPYASNTIETVVVKELCMLKAELKKVEGQEIDIEDYIQPSLANIMFIMMVGKRFDYDHKIQRSMTCMTEEFGNMTSNMKAMIFLTLFPFIQYLPFGPGAMCIRWKAALDEIMKYMLDDIRAEGREAWENGEGFVYDLLKTQEKNQLTDKEVYGVIRDMFLAGIVTTKSSLYSLFLFMVHMPEEQGKLHKELDDLGVGEDPCLDYIDKMPYTQAMILETLRLASVVQLSVYHVVTKDIKLYGYDIPKGAILVPNIWKVHHDDTLWTDPWKFVPDRFIDQQDGTLLPIDDPVRKNLIPFSLGKRRCIGENFARTRMFLFISHLCQAFHFYSDNPDNLPSMDPSTFNPSPFNKPYSYKLKVEMRP